MLRDGMKWLLTRGVSKRLLAMADSLPGAHSLLRKLSYPRVAFGSFADAWKGAASDRQARHGEETIEIHKNLVDKLRTSDPKVLQWMTSLAKSNRLRVVEFGGSVGNIYYTYRSHLPPTLKLDWVVVDLPAVIAAGRQLAAEKNATELRFVESLTGIDQPFDLLLASGSLHYWESDMASWLAQLSTPAEHIIVNRSPVHDTHETFYTVQQTETFAVPCVVRNRTALVNEFVRQGYELVDDWAAPELSLTMTWFPRLSMDHYSGFYFRKLP